MFGRKKKKKQKKALLEAQQQAAAFQLHHAMTFPRPTSNLSVPAILQDGSYEFDQLSGSDDMSESMSLTGEYCGTSYVQPSTTVVPTAPIQMPAPSQPPIALPQSLPVVVSSEPVTAQYHVMQQPTPTQYIAPPPVPTTPVVTTNTLNRQQLYQEQLHTLRRGQSQPAIASIPTVPPPLPLTAPPISMATSTLEYQLTRPEQPTVTTVTTSSTLSRSSGHKKNYAVTKIDPVKQELIKTAISFGLGRGIDATKKSPWTDKSSFQIRRIHSSIIETNEGGNLTRYHHELTSVSDLDDLFQASLHPPEIPVTIHVEGDSDRCISSSRQIIGKRVLTRTIAFQTENEEKYTDGENPRISKDSNLVQRDPTEVVYNTQNSSLSFEERVYQWLLHKIIYKSMRIGQRLDVRSDENYADQLTKLIHSKKSLVRVDEEIKIGCAEIVQALRVTHYVTSISLGAAEYRMMSEGEYHKQLAQGGAFGLDTLAEAAMSSGNGFMMKRSSSRKELAKTCTKMSHVRKIGNIGENDKVERGSADEVVLTIQVQPITRLIRIPIVKASFHKAIENYMEKTSASEGGPFIIKCTGRDIYLTVNKYNNYEVEGTEIPAEASLFYFQSTDDGGNPFDFHIAYYGEDVGPDESGATPDKIATGNDIGRYLEACVSAKGHCPGPLLMKHSVKVRNTRFTLRSRLSKKYSKSHLNAWIAGEDAFYITCGTHKFKRDCYLAVKNSTQTDLLGKHFFITEGLPSIHMHNGDNIFMLFQVLPKDSLDTKKGDGRETPGKLPVQPSEIMTREQPPQLLT